MPAIMISPVAGSNPVASGSRIEIVAGGPRPGRMPTRVPSRQPTMSHSRLVGVDRGLKAVEQTVDGAFTGGLPPAEFSPRPPSGSVPQGSSWELHLEQGVEQQAHRQEVAAAA